MMVTNNSIKLVSFQGFLLNAIELEGKISEWWWEKKNYDKFYGTKIEMTEKKIQKVGSRCFKPMTGPKSRDLRASLSSANNCSAT